MEKYSRSVELCGGPSKGHHTKMVNQITCAGALAGVVEGIMYASKSGIDLDKTLEIIGLGAANSFQLQVMGKRILNKNLEAGCYVEHFIKDL